MKKKLIVTLVVCLAAATAIAGQRPKIGTQNSEVVAAPKQVPVDTQALARQQARQWREATRYRSLIVTPHAEASGEEFRLQQQVGVALARMDFVPKERIQHVTWLMQSPALITGWDGTIEKTTRVPGGVHVTVRIHPKHTMGGVAAVDGHAIEHYFYTNGRLQYLGSENRQPKVITIN